MSFFFALALGAFTSLPAEASLSRLTCDTQGPVFMQAEVSLLRDQWDSVSNGGYTLELSSDPRGRETWVKIIVSQDGGGSNFSTVQTIPLVGGSREILSEWIDDFLLRCRVR
ncbi:MAG TPA: hypothetical protein VIH99_12665 [Bdellovibrionota bacterium]|jgi:hypothetical protein